MLKSLPNVTPLTFEGVRRISWVFAPEWVLSYLHVGTLTSPADCPAERGTLVNATTPNKDTITTTCARKENLHLLQVSLQVELRAVKRLFTCPPVEGELSAFLDSNGSVDRASSISRIHLKPRSAKTYGHLNSNYPGRKRAQRLNSKRDFSVDYRC